MQTAETENRLANLTLGEMQHLLRGCSRTWPTNQPRKVGLEGFLLSRGSGISDSLSLSIPEVRHAGASNRHLSPVNGPRSLD